ALRFAVAPYGGGGSFFGAVKLSGSHRASLEMIARGEAGVAAIDCVTHAFLERVRPHLMRATRILEATAPAPTLPFITQSTREVGQPDLDPRDRVAQALLHRRPRALGRTARAPRTPAEPDRPCELLRQKFDLNAGAIGTAGVCESLGLLELLAKIEETAAIAL